MLVLIGPAIAQAAVNVVLVDGSLESREVRLHAIGQEQVRFAGADRRLVTEPVGRYVELRFDPDPAESRSTPWVEMTDGQRLTGEPAGGQEMAQTLGWKTAGLGTFELSLDRIRALRRTTPIPEAGMADVIISANGDRLEGFVLGMSGQAIAFQPSGSQQTLTLQWSQLGSMRLANPDADRISDRYQVTLANGDRLLVSDLAFTGSVFRLAAVLRPSGQPVELGHRAVRRIAVPGSAGQLRPLTQMPREKIGGGKVFGVNWPIRTRDRGIEMHAPVTVRIDLPEGARRVAGVARLAVEPRHRQAAQQWSDMTVVLRQGETVLWRAAITGQSTEASFNVAVREGALTLEVQPGRRGPVLDRVRIENAVVLVGEE